MSADIDEFIPDIEKINHEALLDRLDKAADFAEILGSEWLYNTIDSAMGQIRYLQRLIEKRESKGS